MTKSFWDAMYEDTPLKQIPWQLTQADWFSELLDSGVITGKTALDLGCGTGAKSIQLAKAGFKKIVGVDIAPKAIEYAKANAEKAGVSSQTEFVQANATDLSFLGDKKFDFVLDWASLHCIPASKRQNYVDGIVTHADKDSTLLLRVFAKDGTADSFIDDRGIAKTTIYTFDDDMINNLFGQHFEIVKTNNSKPRTHAARSFDEYLMRRRA